MTKQGILLAAFGAGSDHAQRTLNTFATMARDVFPDIPVRWAFTSGTLRQRRADEGWKIDSAGKALEKMWFEKFSHVAVQSLHVVPGREYTDLLADAEALSHPSAGDDDMAFARITVGAPLLATDEDVERTARAMVRHAPAGRGAREAVLYMGHGTRHQGDAMYGMLSARVRAEDARIHIATMDGATTIEDIIPILHDEGVTRAWLLPLLAVAGGHVRRDMVGKGPDSWQSRLVAAGISCTPVLKGAAEYDGFASIWLDHLREAVAGLSR